MSYIYSWDRLLCGDYKHRLVELQRAHSITGRAQAIDCVKPERLLRKVQTSSGGRHAPRSTCASATRGLAQHRFQLYSSRLLCRLAGGNPRAAWIRLRRSLTLHISTKSYPMTGRPHDARPSLLEGIDAWKELMRSGYSAVFSGKGF